MATFGETLRSRREAGGYGLRRFAGLAGISPTYLSRVENGDVDPPTAERIRCIARLLGEDPDSLTLIAGRIPDDLPAIIAGSPGIIGLLRAIDGLNSVQLHELKQIAIRMKGPHMTGEIPMDPLAIMARDMAEIAAREYMLKFGRTPAEGVKTIGKDMMYCHIDSAWKKCRNALEAAKAVSIFDNYYMTWERTFLAT